ncbi:glycoside hydrolase [Meredithblackwellia eburnea MCA 4105]
MTTPLPTLISSTFLTTTPAPLSVRPSIGTRTASSRSLPLSTHPRINLIIPESKAPNELHQGLKKVVQSRKRGNLTWITPDQEQQQPEWGTAKESWVIHFVKNDQLAPRSLDIHVSHDDFTTSRSSGTQFVVTVSYFRVIEAFRGLGHVLAISRDLSSFTHPDLSPTDENEMDTTSDSSPSTPTINTTSTSTSGGGLKWSGNVGSRLRRHEECLFESVGVMIDCSRNGVLLPSSIISLLITLALSGTNVLQLYCEDTYEIPGEPFFGYFRGAYKEGELREVDGVAEELGIEIIPCIQTLGHLGQMLQWPTYGVLRDTSEVLLAEAVETYAFIEKMIKAISTPFRSKKIHIGMDEAHGVSEGRYRQFFGYKDSTKVFTDHLERVKQICERNGLKPMIWSDMLFCLQAKNNSLSSYYDPSNTVTPQLAASMPDVDTVYWSYYHASPKPYEEKIRSHWQLTGRAPWMASGVWTWSRFWTALPFTFATIRASMIASKLPTSGIQHVMTTIWGDEGNECDLYSALPGILYHAEHAYTKREEQEVEANLLRRKFDAVVEADFEDYLFASKLDDTQPEALPIDAKTHYTPNLAKFLLWEEPFYSFLSPQYKGFDLESHYNHVATYLSQALSSDFTTMSTSPSAIPHSITDFPLNSRLKLPLLLARILELKCHLRERLVGAYKSGDRAELEALAGKADGSRMNRLRRLVGELHDTHRQNWFSMYKPFGFEVLDLRYGGLRSRLETMHRRLISYLDEDDATVSSIPELEVDLQEIYKGQGPNLMIDWNRASRPQYV